MRLLFSTLGTDPRYGFGLWREAITSRIVPIEHTKLGDGDFRGIIEVADVGGLAFTRVSTSGVRTESTLATIRRHPRPDALAVKIKLSGLTDATQQDREVPMGAGDIAVFDQRPTVLTASADSRALFIEVPRERLERMLGSARLYSALTVGADQASTSLAVTFVQELIRVHSGLDAETAARMASIGLDLVVASIAERLAREVPKSLHGTVVVQRAKAYVEANLGDPTLDPPQLAAAVGVSLRRLQELFHERGRHVSEWIWHRRLDVAARRLADRGHAHLSIGSLAYGCGFVSQAHFARRFKERHGMTPSEYRQSQLAALSA